MKPGQSVFHQQFGHGTVLFSSGKNVRVSFDDGIHLIHAAYLDNEAPTVYTTKHNAAIR